MSSFKYIESGWDGYRQMVVPQDASEAQITDTRQAYYAGAAVLFQTLLRALDPGEEETDDDMQLMASLQAEIDEFGLELDLRMLPAGGHG